MRFPFIKSRLSKKKTEAAEEKFLGVQGGTSPL